VRFRLAVGKDGRVTKCYIMQTSGSAVLDHATCRIMQARAKFSPARSAAGGPVEGAVEDSVSWILR
jgi:protein TonB